MILVFIREFKDDDYTGNSKSIRERLTDSKILEDFILDKVSQAN
jgi:hypothetical protein